LEKPVTGRSLRLAALAMIDDTPMAVTEIAVMKLSTTVLVKVNNYTVPGITL
jgi:hypothetical protein